jgi:hypothetical protein
MEISKCSKEKYFKFSRIDGQLEMIAMNAITVYG